MRRVRASMVAVLVGALLIAGCAGQPVLYNHFINSGYSPTEFGVGAGRKDLRTVLSGDPFGVGDAEFAAATIAILNRHQPFLQPTHFTTTPGENASPRHRMVLIFDQPRIPVFQLCRARLRRRRRDPPSPSPERYPARRGRVLPARRRAHGGPGQDRRGRGSERSQVRPAARSDRPRPVPAGRPERRRRALAHGRTPRAGLIRRVPRDAAS